MIKNIADETIALLEPKTKKLALQKYIEGYKDGFTHGAWLSLKGPYIVNEETLDAGMSNILNKHFPETDHK